MVKVLQSQGLLLKEYLKKPLAKREEMVSRVDLVKQLKEKNPNLNNSEIETIIEIFSKCIVDGLKQGELLSLEVLVLLYRKNKRKLFRET